MREGLTKDNKATGNLILDLTIRKCSWWKTVYKFFYAYDKKEGWYFPLKVELLQEKKKNDEEKWTVYYFFLQKLCLTQYWKKKFNNVDADSNYLVLSTNYILVSMMLET